MWGLLQGQLMQQHALDISTSNEDKLRMTPSRLGFGENGPRGDRKTISATPAVTGWLIFLVLLVWGTAMVLLTLTEAQELADRLFWQQQSFTGEAAIQARLPDFYDETYGERGMLGLQEERPDLLEYWMLSSLKTSAIYSLNGRVTERVLSPLKDQEFIPIETAVAFYDGSGRLLHAGGDYLYFGYCTEEEWARGDDIARHYGWIDLSEGKGAEDWHDDPWLRFRTMYAGTRSLHDIVALKITGTLHEPFDSGTGSITPWKVEFTTETFVYQAVYPETQQEGYDGHEPPERSYTLSALDEKGLLNWQLQFDRSQEYRGQGTPVTIYALYPEMTSYSGKPVRYLGKTFESLSQLLTEREIVTTPESGSALIRPGSLSSSYTLRDLYVFGGLSYLRGGSETLLVTATLSHPLQAAIQRLRGVYFWTGLLALVLTLLVRSRIRSRLIQPLRELSAGMRDNWRTLYPPDRPVALWREAEDLKRLYETEAEDRQYQKNKVARLETALHYAENAEKERRKMLSDMAHELKTPLAVLHGYAEGLKERINEEKRDEYADIILRETEKLDGMVMELLELSRLEAGKVVLAADSFDLRELTEEVCRSLSRSMEEKEQRLTLIGEGAFPLQADEGRLRQAVTNLLSNASKYGREGSEIRVKLDREGKHLRFSVQNDCEPLTGEQLDKVWESFYRVNPARNDKGTGLGLPIVKGIIELHGGTVFGNSIDGGVEFGFML